ncbi:MAG TPA: serine hydrolase domain-containing protein, partial [Candidatus Obscuribacterales bacterium]
MFSSYNNFRTARGLSLLLVLLLLAAPAMARQVEPTMGQEFEQAAKEHLGSLKLPAAALVVADATGTRTYYAQGMKPDSSLPLGRIGELFVALLALKQVETGKLRLSDSANDFLDGYGIQADYGEITVRNLLERSSGLPLRESSLYVSEARKVPTFKNLLIQDLKPAVLPPGQAISQHSFGDVLLAEITSVQGKAPLPDQIQKQILQPLGMKDVRLPDPKAKDLSLSGYDSEGFPFRRLKASAHELHDWQARPEAIGSLLKALLGKSPKVVTPAMQKRLLSRSLKLNPGLPTSSLGLLESSLHGHRYFYLDSNWFGETARLAVFPDKGQAFFLAYDTSHPGLKDDWTETFVQSLGAGSIAKLQTKSAGSGLSPSGQWSYFRANSDSNSILKVLDLFRSAKVILSGEQLAQELVVESDNGVFQGKVLS